MEGAGLGEGWKGVGHETRTNRKSDLSDSTETGTVRQNKRTGEGIVSLHGVERSGCSADECLSRDEYGEVGGRE